MNLVSAGVPLVTFLRMLRINWTTSHLGIDLRCDASLRSFHLVLLKVESFIVLQDGDRYWVFWNPRLVPDISFPPFKYENSPPALPEDRKLTVQVGRLCRDSLFFTDSAWSADDHTRSMF